MAVPDAVHVSAGDCTARPSRYELHLQQVNVVCAKPRKALVDGFLNLCGRDARYAVIVPRITCPLPIP